MFIYVEKHNLFDGMNKKTSVEIAIIFYIFFFVLFSTAFAETTVTCSSGQIIGDANGDGQVTTDDSNLIFNISLGIIAKPQNICCVDINGDGQITSGDAQYAYDIFVGNKTSPGKCELTCTDTDGGINYYLKGYTKGILGGANCLAGTSAGRTVCSGEYVELYDKCNDYNTNNLDELYCDNNKVMTIGKTCENGCKDGACLTQTSKKLDFWTEKTTYYQGETVQFKLKVTDTDGTPFTPEEGAKAYLYVTTPANNANNWNQQLWYNSNTLYYEYNPISNSETVIGKYSAYIVVSSPTEKYTSNTIYFSILNAENKCTDSDGGKNYYVKGYVKGYFGVKEDICFDENYLNEATCDSAGNYLSVGYICPNGCYDGACINTTQTCTDSDVTAQYPDGRNYYTKGRTIVGTGIAIDYCTDSTGATSSTTGDYVGEWWCYTDGTVHEDVYKCPNGCANGACIQGEMTCDNLKATNPKFFDLCWSQLFTHVCFDKYTGQYQGCTKGEDGCSVNNVNAARNIACKTNSCDLGVENADCTCPSGYKKTEKFTSNCIGNTCTKGPAVYKCETVCPAYIRMNFDKQYYNVGDKIKIVINIYDKDNNPVPNFDFKVAYYGPNGDKNVVNLRTDNNGLYATEGDIADNSQFYTGNWKFIAFVDKNGCNYISDEENIYVNIQKPYCGDGICNGYEKATCPEYNCSTEETKTITAGSLTSIGGINVFLKEAYYLSSTDQTQNSAKFLFGYPIYEAVLSSGKLLLLEETTIKLVGVTSPTQAVINVTSKGGSEQKIVKTDSLSTINGMDIYLEEAYYLSSTDQTQNSAKFLHSVDIQEQIINSGKTLRFTINGEVYDITLVGVKSTTQAVVKVYLARSVCVPPYPCTPCPQDCKELYCNDYPSNPSCICRDGYVKEEEKICTTCPSNDSTCLSACQTIYKCVPQKIWIYPRTDKNSYKLNEPVNIYATSDKDVDLYIIVKNPYGIKTNVNMKKICAATSDSVVGSTGITEIVCTQEAKLCPDGSYVGRDPANNCEFDPCPPIACSKPVCKDGSDPVDTGKVDAYGCKIYLCHPVACKMCVGGIDTGKIDSNGCPIYSCPDIACSIPICKDGSDPVDTGKVDAYGCKIYSCTPQTIQRCEYSGTYKNTDAVGTYTIEGKTSDERVTVSSGSFAVYDPAIFNKYLITKDIEDYKFLDASTNNVNDGDVQGTLYMATYTNGLNRYVAGVIDLGSKENVQKIVKKILSQSSNYEQTNIGDYYVYKISSSQSGYLWTYKTFLAIVYSEATIQYASVSEAQLVTETVSKVSTSTTATSSLLSPTGMAVSVQETSTAVASTPSIIGTTTSTSKISQPESIEPTALLKAYLNMYPSDIKAIGSECGNKGGYCVSYAASCKTSYEQVDYSCAKTSDKCCIKKVAPEEILNIILKLEQLKVSLNELKPISDALSDYYFSINDNANGNKFLEISKMLERAVNKTDDILIKIRNNKDNLDPIRDEIKQDIQDIKNYINDIVNKLLEAPTGEAI